MLTEAIQLKTEVSFSLLVVRDSQTLAALTATICKHFLTANSGHARAKSVGTDTMGAAWLISALHYNLLLRKRGRKETIERAILSSVVFSLLAL